MEDSDRLKAYSAMADVSRKWVSALDAKAGFISGLCAVTLAFVWTGARLSDEHGTVKYLALAATALLLISLFLTLRVVLPRVSLRHAFGSTQEYKNGYEPVSFYGYVANNFPLDSHGAYVALVVSMDEKALAREALEQHYTLCHVLQRKSRGIAWAGWVWLIAFSLIVGALMLRG